ncbi:MAG: PTS sugar transporter subunit IIB [Thermodesulfobacteriota bacterium]
MVWRDGCGSWDNSAMITLVRVDDRLLHGQVIHAWVPATRSDMLVVVAEESVHRILEKELSSLAAECGCEVKVFDDLGACSFLKDAALDNRRVMVVMSSIAEAEKIYKADFNYTTLNIGNIHHGDFKTRLSASTMITEEEEKALERLRSHGVRVDVRALPEAEAGRA